MQPSFDSRCRRKAGLISEQKKTQPGTDRDQWINRELAKLQSVPLLSPRDLERRADAERVRNWKARRDEVARRRVDAGKSQTLADGRAWAMEFDRELQSPEIRKQHQAEVAAKARGDSKV